MAEPTPATPAPEVTARKGWVTTAIAVGAAVALGLFAGWLARSLLGPAPEPICDKLCEFADIPAVAANANWKAQIAQANCRCNALPKHAAPARPVEGPPPGH